MYLVAVTFDAAEADRETCRIRLARQAADSLNEPGCQRFDVWEDTARTGRFFLFEIYDDRSAFDVHLATPHFQSFDAEVGPLMIGKTVETWGLLPG